MDSFDHYTHRWQKEYHPQDDTGSAKKQNIGNHLGELHLATLHNGSDNDTTRGPRFTIICHTATMPTHSIRINTESFLEHSSVIYHQNQPHVKGSHHPTWPHSIPRMLVWKDLQGHEILLLPGNTACHPSSSWSTEFNSKEWRFWRETFQVLPFNLLLDLGQATKLLLASISSSVKWE